MEKIPWLLLSSNTDGEDTMVITEPENLGGEQGKTGDANSRNTLEYKMLVIEGGNPEKLEGKEIDSNSSSSEEEDDLVGNKSINHIQNVFVVLSQ